MSPKYAFLSPHLLFRRILKTCNISFFYINLRKNYEMHRNFKAARNS